MKYYSRRKKEASSIFTSPASSLQVSIREDSFFYLITSLFLIYGRSTSGIITEPSSC
jgi:hypothetical protein